MYFVETLIAALATGSVSSIITTYFSYRKKIFEARVDIKKETFLDALNILDSQASYYFKENGAVLNEVPMEKVRSTFNKLLIFSDSLEIPNKFIIFLLGDKDNKLTTLNQFRNLIRKEIGLEEINFSDAPYKNVSFLNSIICAEEVKGNMTKSGKAEKESK